jgi:hypothetical protein
MFTCTDDAAALITSLIHDADLPDGSGLRLILDAATRSLAMSWPPGPPPRPCSPR